MALELGLIGSAWHGTGLTVEEGIRKAKEIGFDAYENVRELAGHAAAQGIELAIELVEEAYRETARIMAEIGARDAAGWQRASSI